jgi:Cu(I)/Ag(I) efflux system membrane fusion protein
MKYIFLSLFIVLSMNAKILSAKQVFNKSIIKVTEKNITIKKEFYGTTTYDESKIRDVSLRFSGFIKDLKANSTHQYIQKNDSLFKIYSKEVSIALDELIMAVKYENAKELINNIEERLELLDISKHTINMVKKTQKIPYYVDIKSKYTGVIINKKINESSYANKGTTLMQLADLSTIWVNAQIYQKDLAFIKNAMNAIVYIDGVGQYNAKLALIHPIVQKDTKTIPVRLILKNNKMTIFPNMFAKISFLKTSKKMLVLPKSAVITKSNKHYVFKPLSNNQFEPVEVQATRINSMQFKITSGLQVGDEVINNALFMLDSDAVTNGLYDEDDDW